jgi:hypothetical protein
MDEAAVVRALQRLVYVDKLLTREEAARYCALVGIAQPELDRSG